MSEMGKDYLTGLLTRQELYQWYEGLPENSRLQFMFMDLDNFKSVNDTYGHNIGDELLKAVANILRECMDQEVCARLGGDEFVLVACGEYTREDMIAVAENIIRRVKKKEGFQRISTDVSASIGILLDENSNEQLNEILFKIDTAMYQAKSLGKSCYVIFNDIAEQVYDEVQMEKQQVEALQKNEFEIRFKPIINAQTSRLFLSEAYLVWNMQDGRCRHQDEFLPLFERNGFIRSLNLWLFEEICKHIQNYHRTFHAKGKVGVRISKLLLLEKGLPELLESVMALYGVENQELCLDVEETIFTKGKEEILLTLESLKAHGFGVSVINVGTDFTSLKYWDRLQLDSIKFSIQYLKTAMSTSRGKQVIKTLFAMGNDLKMKVIADGIENKEEVIFLSNCGCSAISGSYYSEPLSLKEYTTYVEGKIARGEKKVSFSFLQDYHSVDGKFEGMVQGDGIKLVPGISRNWGSIYFPGGASMNNVVELPTSLLAEDSYTIGMWLKPVDSLGWTSAFYARYLGGFCSYAPYLVGGGSGFRIKEDEDVNVWHDILGRQLQVDKWSFVCISYDAKSGISRYYINGRKCGYLMDVPLLPCCRQILLGGDPFQCSYHGYLSALTIYDSAKSEDDIVGWYRSFLEEKDFQGVKEEFWLE